MSSDSKKKKERKNERREGIHFIEGQPSSPELLFFMEYRHFSDLDFITFGHKDLFVSLDCRGLYIDAQTEVKQCDAIHWPQSSIYRYTHVRANAKVRHNMALAISIRSSILPLRCCSYAGDVGRMWSLSICPIWSYFIFHLEYFCALLSTWYEAAKQTLKTIDKIEAFRLMRAGLISNMHNISIFTYRCAR